jgi:predicted hotdog family 3-hydroxylacyl-ACP dehydratase
LIEKEELQTLIPHKGKMFLLSRVIEYDTAHSIRVEYDITEQCLFYDPAVDGVPSWVGFELMAQAIYVLSGIKVREGGEKPNMGFILSIQSVRMEIPLFKNGSTVEICVKEIDYTDMIYTFEGEALLEGRKVMEGRIMVMEISDERFKSMVREADLR